MAELVEYSLVVIASTLFVTGSVAVYGSFTSFESGLSLHAAFGLVAGLASRAAESGSANATVALPASTVACQAGVLSMTVGNASLEERLPLTCGFVVGVPAGVHVLTFTDDSSQLTLSVT